MTSEEFAERVRQDVIEQNAAVNVELLEMAPSVILDESLRTVVVAFARMDDSQKDAVRMLVRRILVDTVSNVFGILDGSTLLKGFREEFLLTYGKGREVLSGELQALLLSTIAKA